jgi:chromosome partitioning protein
MIHTIAHSKGGSKKSTTAWHLSHGMKKRYPNKKVIVIDLDLQSTTTVVNNIRVQKTNLEGLNIFRVRDVATLLNLLEIHKDDIVIIDTGGFDKDINRVAINKADIVIVPLFSSIHDVCGLKMFDSILTAVNRLDIKVLLTMVHPLQTNFKQIEIEIEKYPNAELLNTKIVDHNDNHKLMWLGLSVYDINSKLCKRYDGVIDELKN